MLQREQVFEFFSNFLILFEVTPPVGYYDWKLLSFDFLKVIGPIFINFYGFNGFVPVIFCCFYYRDLIFVINGPNLVNLLNTN